MNEVEQGVVKHLNTDKGYGFIKRSPAGQDVFFHMSALVNVEFEDLDVGTPVTFIDGTGNDGKPRATTVRRVG